jgi:glycosyltransferase involved in cell wall biosynthesis
VTIHDVFPLSARNYFTEDYRRKFSALLLKAIGRAARILVPSHYTAEQLVRHAEVGRQRIRIIPYGVTLPLSLMQPDERLRQREQVVGNGNEMVLLVGVLENRKNTLNALRALSKLPERYRLVLVGGDGYGSEAIHDFIRKEQWASRVTLLGRVSDERIATLYQAASVLLFPSLEEGFGLPVLEAMAHELPVVASCASSLPEVGGEAALYVDPHDPADIAEKVRRAVEDSSQRGRMIEQGRARAQEFSWQRVVERTCEVYDEVLAE